MTDLSVTSQQFSEVESLHQWMFDLVSPYVKGRILEIESGLDQLSNLFIKKGMAIHLSNSNRTTCKRLYENYKEVSTVRTVQVVNIHDPDFLQAHAEMKDVFSTVLALNLSGEGRMDKTALANVRLILREGGRLILANPAFTALYNGLDEDLDEWKQYNRDTIVKLLSDDFELLKIRVFSLAEWGLFSIAICSRN